MRKSYYILYKKILLYTIYTIYDKTDTWPFQKGLIGSIKEKSCSVPEVITSAAVSTHTYENYLYILVQTLYNER